jgi:hypothetical protein
MFRATMSMVHSEAEFPATKSGGGADELKAAVLPSIIQ